MITKDSETWTDIAVPALVTEDLADVVCGYHLALIRPQPNSVGAFIGWAIGAVGPREQYQVAANGITRFGLTIDAIRNSILPMPPLLEQHSIVRFLAHETAKIDALVAKQQELIGLLQEKRTALISHAVTKGLDPEAAMKDSGVEWLGETPAHWALQPLRTLARRGPRTFTDGDWIESLYITDGGVRLIQTGNVGIGHYKEQGFRYVSENTFSELGCTEVRPDDVLICRLAHPVGRACLAPDLGTRMITSVDVCILRSAHEVVPSFLVYSLSASNYLAFMGGICRGGTRDRVSRSTLGSVPIRVPPLSEQYAIAKVLDKETNKIDTMSDKVNEAIDHLNEYRTALISAAVTGKIDVRQQVADLPEPIDYGPLSAKRTIQ